MGSSSEDDYLWEKCSSSDSETMAHEEESDFDKHYKKKLQKELFQNGDLDDSQEEPRVRKKKKKIKRELDSPAVKDEPDSDSRGHPARLNGHAEAAAERVLALKVKEEQASFLVPRDSPRKRPRSAGSGDEAPARKKKKAKKERRDEPDADELPTPDAEELPKKKKKKHKQEIDESDIIIDKFEAEETVVEKRRSVTGSSKIVQDKPFTSKEFVEDDSDSDEEHRSTAPPAPLPPPSPKNSRSPEPAPRSMKIRERIIYEEVSQDRVSLSPSVSPRVSPRRDGPEPAPSGRLARYLRAHRHLAVVPARAADHADDADACVSAEDDVWLVRCPRSLDAATLAGVSLAPGARGRVRAGAGAGAGGDAGEGAGWEAAPAGCGARAALLAGGARWAVRGARVRGALQLRARVPRVRAPPAASPEGEAPVPLPATKTRHPLLGVDYTRAPRAPRPRPDPALATRDELDDSERREKKKKRKKEKWKREREQEAPARSPSPLPRKKRRAAPAADVWDSERAIEESLFDF